MPYDAFWKTLIGCCTLLLSTYSFASENEYTIIFGGANYYAPHHFRNDDEVIGFDIDLVTAIAERNGWAIEFRFDDWDVIQRDLAEGRIDVVPMFISPSRQQQYLFSDPILIANHFLYGIDSTESLRSLDELAGHTVAAETESFAIQELARLGSGATIVPASSEAEALRMAARGEVEYAISPLIPAEYTILQENLPVARHSPPLLPVAYGFAISPEKSELVPQFNSTLIELNRQGFIDSLSDRWLTQDDDLSTSQWLWLTIPLAAAAVFFLFGVYRYWRQLQSVSDRLSIKSRELRAAKKREISSYRTDPLTGLHTRNYFLSRSGRALEKAKSEKTLIAIGVFRFRDLDLIQQSRGYGVADDFIQQISGKLNTQNRCLSGYFGQGEFSLLVERARDLDHAVNEISAVIDSLDGGYQVKDMFYQPGICAGIVLCSDINDDEYELLRKAHIALKTAEKDNKKLVIYNPGLEPASNEIGLMSDLKRALVNGGISWAFQPLLNVREQKIESAEMLIRWNHPQHGWIPPDKFIPQAERAGLINQVTRTVVDSAVTTIRTWRQAGITCRLSVNISANDLADSDNVDYLIEKSGEVGRFLTLEITETAIMKDVDIILANAERLKSREFKLALDDYGTGYSSLEYLKRFQFDELKVDKLFVSNLKDSERDLKLTQASIDLGHDLGAKVVAEGVEDNETARLLVDLDCDVLQGYGISRPLPIREFNEFQSNFAFDLG